jgi:hypothetical protein
MSRASSLIVGLLLVACGKERIESTRLERLEEAVSRQEQSVDQVAVRAQHLGGRWHDVALEYEKVAFRRMQAQAALSTAALSYGNASGHFLEASAVAQRADIEWRLFETLVQTAAAVDAANLDSGRTARLARDDVGSLDCDSGMSTARYRALLTAAGQSLVGLDVDHIVPHSLGGADHPANYQLLPSSTNRSLGNAWNEDKCLSVGAERCSRAVTVSRRCGSMASLGF